MLSCFERVNVCFETDRHIRYWFIHTVEGKHTVEGHDQQGTHPHTYQTQERHAHSHVEKCVCVRLGGLKWPPGRQRHSREQQQYGCLARLSDATVDMDAATMEIIIQAPRRGGNSLVNIFSGPFGSNTHSAQEAAPFVMVPSGFSSSRSVEHESTRNSA
mmetsp:Transcript_26516/g.76017  ORF Transcript_26516/g.76017 Transcript_26516/m.76017 type:complete len:159 (+) Transcript_26516:541-1017(+)